MNSLDQTCIKPAPDFARLERVLRRDGIPDCVPFFEIYANDEFQEALLGRPVRDIASTVEFYHRAGYDYVPVKAQPGWVTGSLIDRSQGYPITGWESFDTYPWPKPESIAYTDFDSVAKSLPDGMKIVGMSGGPLGCVAGLLGLEQFFVALFDQPDLVQAILQRAEGVLSSVIATMAGMNTVGACVVMDDFGFKTQTLISPDLLRRHILPVHKKLASIAHDAGKPYILHSCGHITALMEDLIEDVRIDARHSYEDAVTPVEEVKREYGTRVAILGGFDMDRLCRSSEKEVRAYTRKLVTELGSDGGYALGTGNTVAPFVPIPNYLAMIDEAWRLRN